jgi:endogenous inhibitor of DNA gyrase (YacG/DUF329 family)
MITARCPICDRLMEGRLQAEWPLLPFCSERCRRIDLGRWLGEAYRVPATRDREESEAEAPDERDIP